MSEKSKLVIEPPKVKRKNSDSHTRKTDSFKCINSPLDHVLFLQRTIGNQAVQRLIQAELRIGQPEDIYEQEAERVMRITEPKNTGGGEYRNFALTPSMVLSLQSKVGNKAVAQFLASRVPVQRKDSCTSCSKGGSYLTEESAEVENRITDGSLAVQRTIGAGHDLTSPRFAGDLKLEACFDDEARLTKGDTGDSVTKVQQALVELGYDVGPAGADGIYGQKTWNAVKTFKKNEQLGWEHMGDVGPGTMGRLNELFPGSEIGPVVPITSDGPPEWGLFQCAGVETKEGHMDSIGGAGNVGAVSRTELTITCIFPLALSDFRGTAPAGNPWAAHIEIVIGPGILSPIEVSYNSGLSWVNREQVPTGIQQPQKVAWIEQAEARCRSELHGKANAVWHQPPPQQCPAAAENMSEQVAMSEPQCTTVIRDNFYKEFARRGNTDLLRHEQYHVRLACALAKNGNEIIASEMAKGRSFLDALLLVLPIVISRNGGYQQQYDEQTAHGCNALSQAVWQNRIDSHPASLQVPSP